VVFGILGAVALLLAAAWFARRFKLLRKPRAAVKRRKDRAALEATAVYLELERRLKGLGFERPLHLTPKEFCSGIGVAAPELADPARRIVARYNDVRFGGDSFGSGEVADLRSQIRDLRLKTDAHP
jgi:hypothetical protein